MSAGVAVPRERIESVMRVVGTKSSVEPASSHVGQIRGES